MVSYKYKHKKGVFFYDDNSYPYIYIIWDEMEMMIVGLGESAPEGLTPVSSSASGIVISGLLLILVIIFAILEARKK